MPISLYAATIPSYLQILTAVGGLLEKAETFCKDNGIASTDIIDARLAEDMLSLAYQVKSIVVHSIGAIEGVRRGVFSPDHSELPDSFAVLASRISDTVSALEGIDPTEIESFIGRDVRFSFGQRHVDFTAENFLLSFSQPNFYFHAATTYDILRWKGVPVGKRDFLGAVRKKQ